MFLKEILTVLFSSEDKSERFSLSSAGILGHSRLSLVHGERESDYCPGC